MPYMTRDVEQVVAEVRDAGQAYVVFMDNNLGSNRPYLRRLCRALQPWKSSGAPLCRST